MEALIKQLIEELEEFNRLGRLAFTRLSEAGIKSKEKGYLLMYQKFWEKVIKESEGCTDKIKILASDFPNNKVLMSQQLAFYRSITRYIAESPPDWSAYYQQIDRVLDNVHDLLIDIDTKYKLGQHKNDP